MKKSIFAQNLVKARKNKGWSQQGAADAIKEAGAEKFSRAMLASYECGRTEPDHEGLQNICKAYQVEDLKGFLLDPAFFETKRSPEELHRRYSSLSGAARRAVDALLGLSF